MSLTTRQILALSSLPGVGKKSVIKIGEQEPSFTHDSELASLMEYCKVKVKKAGSNSKETCSQSVIDRALNEADQLLEQSESQDIKVLSCYEDSCFPASLRKAVTIDGKEDPVLILFARGDIDLLQSKMITVIGSRDCTQKGFSAASLISQKLAERGITIVSGLALGCDTAAHQGALKAQDGKTIAILAHGLDRVYPPENRGLAHEILDKGGLLLSEYPLGTQSNSYRFVERDRIQSALGNATIVAQTKTSGGTLHAAQSTVHLNKPLFALKFSDQETNMAVETQGNHMLVKDFGAQYIGGYNSINELEASLDQHLSKIYGNS